MTEDPADPAEDPERLLTEKEKHEFNLRISVLADELAMGAICSCCEGPLRPDEASTVIKGMILSAADSGDDAAFEKVISGESIVLVCGRCDAEGDCPHCKKDETGCAPDAPSTYDPDRVKE